jgi:four helix bundle protein
MDHFTFRKLLVYQKARTMVGRVNKLAERIPRDHLDLRWQLRRSARSVALNIAEGAGEYSPKEKARIYRIARRSSWETVAALDLAIQDGFMTEVDTHQTAEDLQEVSAMLTTVSKRAEARANARASSRRPSPSPRRRPKDKPA